MTNQQLTYHDNARLDTRVREHAGQTQSRAREWFGALTATGTSASGLVLRLALAFAIFPHGAQKLLGWFGGPGVSATIGGFEQYFGIAAPLAFLAIIVEFFAPLALAAGVFTRIAAFAIAVQMLVAARFHLANGFFMNWYGNQAGEGFEYHILAIGIALALVVAGAGRWSLDRKINGAT